MAPQRDSESIGAKGFAIAGLILLTVVAWAVLILIPKLEKLSDIVEQHTAQTLKVAQDEAKKMSEPPPRADPHPLYEALPFESPEEGLPVVEREGRDAYGYPRTYIDGPRLRALLLGRRFDELKLHMESFQAAYEKDFRNEYWAVASAGAFEIPDRRLTPLLDEWVKIHPEHFAPWLARAVHRHALSRFYRGTRFIKDTSIPRQEAMRKQAKLALSDFSKARSIRKRLLGAHISEARCGQVISDDKTRDAATQRALKECPECFWPRLSEQRMLVPQWGGSYEEMEEAAKRALQHSSKNPRLKLIAGYPDFNRADRASLDDAYEEALRHLKRALSHGEYGLYLSFQGHVLRKLKRYDEAEKSLARANDLMPASSTTLGRWGTTLTYLKKRDEALDAFEQALRSNPMDRTAARALDWALDEFRGPAHDLFREKKFKEALAAYDKALEHAPFDIEAQVWRVVAEAHIDRDWDSAVPKLEELTHKLPTYFEAFKQLDYMLARQKRFEEILPHWARYLERVPDDAEAYYERSGTYHHLKEREKSQADLRRACDLEHEDACGRLGVKVGGDKN